MMNHMFNDNESRERIRKNSNNNIPLYWERLNESDQKEYLMLQSRFSSSSCKNRRNKSNETFASIIDSIHSYIFRGDGNEYNRSLVCGLIFLNQMVTIDKDKYKNQEVKKDYIVTNTKQLKILLNKSKSSLNGSFHQIGYELTEDFEDNPFFGDVSKLNKEIPTMPAVIGKLFPEFDNQYNIVRQWTIREREFSYQVTSNRRKPISYLRQRKNKSGKSSSIFGISKIDQQMLLEKPLNLIKNAQEVSEEKEESISNLFDLDSFDNEETDYFNIANFLFDH